MEEFLNSLSIDRAELIGMATDYTLQLLQAILILIAGWVVSGWASRMIRRTLDRIPRMDDTLTPLLASIVRYTIVIITIIAVLSHFGVQTASIIAVLGAAGLAIGLALQGTLQNIAAGIMLLILRPFRNGDFIDAGGTMGTVKEIGLFTTLLDTFDGIYISAPNSSLWNSTIRNFSRNPTRRLDLDVGVSYSDDVNGAIEVLHELLTGDSRVLDDPEPQTMVVALADSAVTIRMRGWTTTDHYWQLLWDMNREAKLRLEGAGFSIPFPQRDIHVHQLPPQAAE